MPRKRACGQPLAGPAHGGVPGRAAHRRLGRWAVGRPEGSLALDREAGGEGHWRLRRLLLPGSGLGIPSLLQGARCAGRERQPVLPTAPALPLAPPGPARPSKALAPVPVARPIPESTVPSLCPPGPVGAPAIPGTEVSGQPRGRCCSHVWGPDVRKAGQVTLGPVLARMSPTTLLAWASMDALKVGPPLHPAPLLRGPHASGTSVGCGHLVP